MSTGQYATPVTPADVERQMLDLLRSNRAAYEELKTCEDEFETATALLEIAKARAYLETFRTDEKWTVQHREAYVVDACAAQRVQVAASTARVKAARAKVAAIRVESDLVRSVGTSVRQSLEMS